MAKRLVTLTHLEDGLEVVLNFDQAMFLLRLLDAEGASIGTKITLVSGLGVKVSESLEQVLDAAEKA